MKRTAVALIALAAGLLAAPVPLGAHHSMAMFEEDPAKRVTLTGAVVEWHWANPHCLLELEVPGEGGQKVRWVVETSNPLDMTNRGWSRSSLKPGDQVSVLTRPMKNGKPLGLIVQVQLADGRVLTTANPTAARPARQ
jgi:hypothetical protein